MRADLLKRHGDILSRVDLQIDEADLGPELGRFFRIKTSALVDQETSNALCAAMERRKVSCLSVISVQIAATTAASPKRNPVEQDMPAALTANKKAPVISEAPETPTTAEPTPSPKTPVFPPVQKAMDPDANDNYRVQVAAHRSAPEAKAHWKRLMSRHGAVLAGRDLYIQEVDLKGRGIYFRVQIGPFADRDNANDYCASLKASNVDCLVVKTPS